MFFKLVSMLMALCTALRLIGSCTLHPSTITDGTDGYEQIRSEQNQCWKHPPIASSPGTCWWRLYSSWFMAVDRAVAHSHHRGQTDSTRLFPVTRFKDQSCKSQSCTCSLHIICRTPRKETFKPLVKLCNSCVQLYAFPYFI